MKALKIINRSLFGIFLVLLTVNIAFAARDIIPMGAIAGNIHGGASILARIMWAACVIVGIALFITAFSQFQTHRRNPKLVPLTTPALYLLLALVALAIPFAERIFGYEDSDQDSDRYGSGYVNIDS